MNMNRLVRCLGFAIVAAGVQTSAAAEQQPTVAEQYQALLKEFQGTSYGYFQATNDAERQAIVARVDNATTKCLELVEKNPTDPIALDALTHVVTQEYWLNAHTTHPGWGKESRQARAIALLLRDHVESDKLAETCKRVHFGFRQESRRFCARSSRRIQIGRSGESPACDWRSFLPTARRDSICLRTSPT